MFTFLKCSLFFTLHKKVLRLQLWYKLPHSICISEASKSPRFTGKPQAFWFYPSLIYQAETQESSAFTFPMEHNHEKYSSLINDLYPFSCIVLQWLSAQGFKKNLGRIWNLIWYFPIIFRLGMILFVYFCCSTLWNFYCFSSDVFHVCLLRRKINTFFVLSSIAIFNPHLILLGFSVL